MTARRTFVVGTLAALCFLAGRPASAWVPTPNRPHMVAAARPTARYVPAREHADPASDHQTPAILLSGEERRAMAGSERGRRSGGADDWAPGDDRRPPPALAIRPIADVPSHWGATHLLI